MTDLTIASVKSEYFRIARRLDATEEFIEFYETPQDLGYSHVELRNGIFHYITTERGAEIARRSTSDPEELMYWLISKLTWEMALRYELEHRNDPQDFRRILFRRQTELLMDINPIWAKKKKAELDAILADHPYLDKKWKPSRPEPE